MNDHLKKIASAAQWLAYWVWWMKKHGTEYPIVAQRQVFEARAYLELLLAQARVQRECNKRTYDRMLRFYRAEYNRWTNHIDPYSGSWGQPL